MSAPPLPIATYRRRRRQALRALGDHADGPLPLLVFAAPWSDPVLDLTPVAGKHRQDPWFAWLSGCMAPGAVLLLNPHAKPTVTLFLEPGDPEKVVWDGERLQPSPATRRAYGVDAVAPLDELRTAVDRALDQSGKRMGLLWRDREPGWQAQEALRWRRRLRGVTVINAEPALVPLRLIKDADEVALHKRAISITWKGLRATLPRLPQLRRESQVAAELIQHYLSPAYEHLAFQPIVGSGINAATLHYKYNNGPLRPRAPVLIDSGATWAGYCADVTRTVPQHGRFDDPRFRELYELVLRANALGRRHARPGITLRELNDLAWAPIIDAGFTRHHGLSHQIGMDVHDPGTSPDQPLRSGMIISNEPGIYLPAEAIGIRIEDDLLITDDGCEELTSMIPKTVRAVERLMTGSSSAPRKR